MAGGIDQRAVLSAGCCRRGATYRRLRATSHLIYRAPPSLERRISIIMMEHILVQLSHNTNINIIVFKCTEWSNLVLKIL